MTKQEWLITLDPLKVFQSIAERRPSGRKLRLAAVACCRRIWHLLTDERSRAAVDAAEKYAEKIITSSDAMEYEGPASDVCDGSREYGSEPGHAAAVCLALWAPTHWGTFQVLQWTREQVGRKDQMEILDCVFGIPYRRPALCNPSWLTSTVLALATGIYEEKAFDRLPILADALQDAGCDSEEFLDHLQQPGEHGRGCWPLDLILGKE